jgi:hypothetical protein
MTQAVIEKTANNDVAILGRVLANGKGRLSSTMARHLLRLRFSDEDMGRMNDLAQRNQDGRLSRSEREELDSFVKVGHVIAILQSEARQALKKKA